MVAVVFKPRVKPTTVISRGATAEPGTCLVSIVAPRPSRLRSMPPPAMPTGERRLNWLPSTFPWLDCTLQHRKWVLDKCSSTPTHFHFLTMLRIDLDDEGSQDLSSPRFP